MCDPVPLRQRIPQLGNFPDLPPFALFGDPHRDQARELLARFNHLFQIRFHGYPLSFGSTYA